MAIPITKNAMNTGNKIGRSGATDLPCWASIAERERVPTAVTVCLCRFLFDNAGPGVLFKTAFLVGLNY
jgi:hypothetical protein